MQPNVQVCHLTACRVGTIADHRCWHLRLVCYFIANAEYSSLITGRHSI